MASTADFRTGFTFELDGGIWSIMDFQHVKMGRGGAICRTKLRNLKTGRVLEKTFRSGEKVNDVMVMRHKMQFLYRSEDVFVFMDNESFEQMEIAANLVDEAEKYMKEGDTVDVLIVQSEPVSLELPTSVELTITQTDPGLKGDTASGGGKPATLETGAVVTVPLFLSEGEKIRVDTRTGAYIERVKS
ncbi:MAG: elongation factor P [Deferribacteres bacterium]|nr:elongation factor P [candidate division KSB1 bacterium]MCB9501541.1 elongation factor P [Deferribacteres bacterium]